MTLKDIRNACLLRVPGLQRALVTRTQRGLIPRMLWTRLQPMGDVALRAPGGQRLVYRSQPGDRFARRVAYSAPRTRNQKSALTLR